MKRFLFKPTVLLALALVLGSCEKELEEKYNNPEKSSKALIPGFFTDILNNDRVRPSYWNVRTFLLMQPAVYSQTAFFSNGNTAYQQSDGYTGEYWRDFYAPGVLGMYRAMETTYNQLGETEKASQEIFMQAASVVVFDQAAQMVDLWGDIPYSQAGSLQTNSTIGNPRFDAQAELYNTFLAGLETAATYFGTAAANPAFSKADILLNGSIDKWRRYANSVRLRLLMRISNVNEGTARTEVLEMLGNAGSYPLMDGGNAANYSPAASDALLRPLTTNTDNLRSALTELTSHYAPDYMLNQVMLPAGDPRLPVMFDKFGTTANGVFVPNPTYRAMPIAFTAAQQEAEFAQYAILDSATFLENPSLPGIVMTASEVNFLKAEAFERWGSTADAQAAYETAVRQSVAFYYYLNGLNAAGGTVLAPPAAEEVNTFVKASPIAYAGGTAEKLALIWTQKWLHFGFLQATQAWAEYRRTNYPQLTFPAAPLSGYERPPLRLVYPSNEKSYNSENYRAVQPADTRETRIFWDVN